MLITVTEHQIKKWMKEEYMCVCVDRCCSSPSPTSRLQFPHVVLLPEARYRLESGVFQDASGAAQLSPALPLALRAILRGVAAMRGACPRESRNGRGGNVYSEDAPVHVGA